MLKQLNGLLEYERYTKEEYLLNRSRPLAALREERMAVIRSGYDAMSHFNIIDTIRSQLDFAKKGLADLGLKEEFLNI